MFGDEYVWNGTEKMERETREKVITSSCSINRLARLLSSFIIIILAIFIWFSAFLCVIFIPWSLERKANKEVVEDRRINKPI